MNEASDFLSAEEIFDQIRQNLPGIGLSTVYRTINLLSDMGIVTKFEFGEGKARYEIAETTTETHHHQLVCEVCYKVVRYSDFSDRECVLHSDMERSFEKKCGFKIRRRVVQHYGLCPDCGKKVSFSRSCNENIYQ